MPVAFSSSEQFVLGEYVVDLNVNCGYAGETLPQWSLIIAKPTGQWVLGNQMLTEVAKYQFQGLAGPKNYQETRELLLKHGFSPDDCDLVVATTERLAPQAQRYVDDYNKENQQAT